MGRRPTPAALHDLHGNPGKRRLRVEPQGVGDLWDPPAWFDGEQRDQWRYALDRAPPGLLTGTDRAILSAWVVAACEHARAAKEVQATGQVIETTNGITIPNPSLSIMNRQASLMVRFGRELGFSPAARVSLGDKA